MLQYRLFEWNLESGLDFVGEELTPSPLQPGQFLHLIDDDDTESERVVSEVHIPVPNVVSKADGSTYIPDPIAILRPQ